jgi:periplasmic divalent cation tolerance protein
MVFSTVGSERNALRISRALVSARLAACVNVVPGIRSIYRWKGKTEEGREFLLIVKTRATNLSRVEETIRKLHTYEVPEILSLRIEKGSDRYLRWLETETTEKGRK